MLSLYFSGKSFAQNEWSVIGGLSYQSGLGFSVGGAYFRHPYMGTRKLESFYAELDCTPNGWGFVPKYGWAFSPHLGLDKGFKSKNKWYGTNAKHFIEFTVATPFYFRKGMGIYFRPEVGYMWSTPFKNFKVRAAYGYDFELKKRDNFESKHGILSVKFIYIFKFTGMFI